MLRAQPAWHPAPRRPQCCGGGGGAGGKTERTLRHVVTQECTCAYAGTRACACACACAYAGTRIHAPSQQVLPEGRALFAGLVGAYLRMCMSRSPSHVTQSRRHGVTPSRHTSHDVTPSRHAVSQSATSAARRTTLAAIHDQAFVKPATLATMIMCSSSQAKAQATPLQPRSPARAQLACRGPPRLAPAPRPSQSWPPACVWPWLPCHTRHAACQKHTNHASAGGCQRGRARLKP
jgi:hypothetical protein